MTPIADDLPDAVERVIEQLIHNPPPEPYYDAGFSIPRSIRFQMQHDAQIHAECLAELRATIADALDEWFDMGACGGFEAGIGLHNDELQALRERAERLRRVVVALGDDQYPRGLGAWPIEPGDLVDNLVPPKSEGE